MTDMPIYFYLFVTVMATCSLSMTRKTAPSCRRKIIDAVKFSMLAADFSFPLTK